MRPILEIKNLSKIYDNGSYALKNVSFQVHKGEFLGVIGLSGSGKSTLMRCLNRLVEPTSGEIIFDNKNLVQLNPGQLRTQRKKIGMIFQQFNLVKRMSVMTNVLSGELSATGTLRSIAGLYSNEQRKKALECLKVVGLQEKSLSRADELSGGQQQRVAIARALMQNPEILLADEPVASLDPATSHSVMDFLAVINKQFGKTIICNLHFLSLVRQYTSRVIALNQGSLVFEGSPQEITEDWFRRIYGDKAKEVGII